VSEQRQSIITNGNDIKLVNFKIDDLAQRCDAVYNTDIGPIKDTLKDLDQRMTAAAREVEHTRNKVINVERRTGEAFDKITEEVKVKILQLDGFDSKVKEAISRALQDNEIGKGIMQTVSGTIQGHDASIGGMRKDLELTAQQLSELATQYAQWQHSHQQLDAEVTRIAATLQRGGPDTFGVQHDGANMGSSRYTTGPGMQSHPPGMGAMPQAFGIDAPNRSWKGKGDFDPWQDARDRSPQGPGGAYQSVFGNGDNNGVFDRRSRHNDLEAVSEKKGIFSDKIATAKENTFDGEHRGAAWRLNVRPYLISKAPVIEQILDYIEEREDQAAAVDDVVHYSGIHPNVVRHLYSELWSFLTVNLQGTARIWINNSKSLEGFEVWR